MPQYDTKNEVDREHNIYQNMYMDTTKRFTTTFNLFFKWRGSVAKLIWHNIGTWIIMYGLLSFIYQQVLFDQYHRSNSLLD